MRTVLSYSLADRAASLVLNSTQAFFCPAAADRRTAMTSPQAVKNSAMACKPREHRLSVQRRQAMI